MTRFHYGALDLISAGMVLVGIVLIQSGSDFVGWLLVGLGILKQFSGR